MVILMVKTLWNEAAWGGVDIRGYRGEKIEGYREFYRKRKVW